MDDTKRRFNTTAIHGGFAGENNFNPSSVPLHRSVAYRFRDTGHAADLFALHEPGHIYSRISNPTIAILEERMRLLEGGTAAVAFASGTSAVFSTIINMCCTGDEIIASKYLYGGTHTLLHNILPQLGITTKCIDVNDIALLDDSIGPKTKMVYCETLGNPRLAPADIAPVAETAHKHGIPVVIDNTFATPYHVRPIDHGADIVIHSLTKWIGGHGTAVGGIVVDAGKFNWNTPRFPLFSAPDESYHGIVWGTDVDADTTNSAFATRLRTVPLRNIGACMSPDNAWIFLQGLETLSLRMDRHSSNALEVAAFLKDRPQVDWVIYPGLPDDPGHVIAQNYFSGGFGGMVVFGIHGGRKAGEQFVNACRLFTHVANVGDAKSLVIHPASTTHAQLSAKEQAEAGIYEEMVRLSIGLEDFHDIFDELLHIFGD